MIRPFIIHSDSHLYYVEAVAALCKKSAISIQYRGTYKLITSGLCKSINTVKTIRDTLHSFHSGWGGLVVQRQVSALINLRKGLFWRKYFRHLQALEVRIQFISTEIVM